MKAAQSKHARLLLSKGISIIGLWLMGNKGIKIAKRKIK